MMRGSGWLLALPLLAGSPALAQVGEILDYPELMRRADLVAIAECQSAADTGARYGHPGLGQALPVQEWRATFRIAAVLKAHSVTGVGSTIGLAYLRFDHDTWRKKDPTRGVVNGGTYLALKPGRNYLLFLKARTVGVYEPVSGLVFPDQAVYLLESSSGFGS